MHEYKLKTKLQEFNII